MDLIVPAVASLVTFGLALWSRRFHQRVRNTPLRTTHLGVKYGMLHVLLFPLAAVFAIWATIAAISNAVGDASRPADERIDDGCATVELALRWLASDEPADHDRGIVVATSVWDRAFVDDAYSNRLRKECPTQVVAMVDAAELSWNS